MKSELGSWAPWWILLATVASQGAAQKPNVVFILVDDMGWNDVSFHGSDQIMTPNIDALAYQGVILQQYYSEAICTPARTALLTGKYPMRLGMHGAPLFDAEDRGIPQTERLLPSYLKELGYATHLVGKWHVGMSRPEYLPTARGYDSHYGLRGGYVDYYTYNGIETWPTNGRLVFGLDFFDNDIPQVDEERYIIEALTDRAVKIIQHHNESQPLFLHLTHNAPHAGSEGSKLQPPLYSPIKNKHIANSDRRFYAEIVAQVDLSVGRVVRALAEKEVLENTIIIFASDNGAPTIGMMNNWGVNFPLRGNKWTPWEGGLRVPAFIWHASFKPHVWNGLMHITDWLPTLTAAAGGKLNETIDGVNQWDSIVNGSESRRSEVLLTIENSTNQWASYRDGDYKIIIGNLTGVNNDYYGEVLMRNKYAPPEYFCTLKSCEVAKIFEERGKSLDYNEVISMRNVTVIRQIDTTRDPTPCVPTQSRGCLYNVIQDPTESHDLWDTANQTAVLLNSRLQSLWSMQMARGPSNLQIAGDPVNFHFIWTPWVFSGSENVTTLA